eukprot:gnl/MRDRNA2_/MRDRNA2_136771_c0_seq1.p1 gnl/MRDRNA2_/MRDRNA2_136771_c0~~gnl/MRDRNA2_/MRDRNA2_136771_c0_seq1.p1  ORF type:complete len:276 (-),score=66.06 gnl/MRDRNA2_/MRDRNA2_136771_c0_seq1:313-1140(-)
MQHAMMQTILMLAMVTGVHGAWPHLQNIQSSQVKPMPFKRLLPLRNQASDMAPVTEETAIAAKDEMSSISPQGTGTVNGVVGVPKLQFKPPQAKPSLYSQGVMGKPKPQPNNWEIKIGKGLIGPGALLGGPYKPPVQKPSLYSQGYTGKKVYQSPQPPYGSSLGWQANAVSKLGDRSMPDSRIASAASVDELMPDSRTTAENLGSPEEAAKSTDEVLVGSAANKPQLEAQQSSAESFLPLLLLSSGFMGVGMAMLYLRRRSSTDITIKESLLTGA